MHYLRYAVRILRSSGMKGESVRFSAGECERMAAEIDGLLWRVKAAEPKGEPLARGTKKTPEAIKESLAVRRLVHYHPGDPEPRFTPMELMRFEDDLSAAVGYMQRLEAQAADLSEALEQVKRERDALKADILRANDQAQEMREVLDYDVHPNCDYELYLALHDALGDVVAWEHKELLNNEVNEDENA